MNNLVITKLEGYSGIRLHNGNPLTFKPGINLLVGRNGSGKSNLISFIQYISTAQGDLRSKIESSYLVPRIKKVVEDGNDNLELRFGALDIAKFRFRDNQGSIKLSLAGVSEPYVAEKILEPGQDLKSHIRLTTKSLTMKFSWTSGNQRPVKFETSGFINANVLGREHDNFVHKVMEGPIKAVSDFIRQRVVDFYTSDEFKGRIQNLENDINKLLWKFLGSTGKQIRIDYANISNSGRIVLSLLDGENYIESGNISTGETALFNLIFALVSAREEPLDVLCMDEPDIHMHDDMIQVLVDELNELVSSLPNLIVVIASHSTALIERLAALGGRKVNLVTFDEHRNVRSDASDIDLINALTRNGVKFSPLMLSGRTNIFIENQFKGEGKKHRDFFLRFFPGNSKPNVIPVGNGDSVQNSETFNGVFEEIINVSSVRSVGIRDGDIWFRSSLVNYMKGALLLKDFIKKLRDKKGAYIKSDSHGSPHFFNFWEIENLYLMPEMLSCWTKNCLSLDLNTYKVIVVTYRTSLAEEYLKTTIKSLARVRIDRVRSVHEARENIARVLDGVKAGITDGMQVLANELIDSLVAEGLTNWLPGKELQKILKGEGYLFNADGVDFDNLTIARELREVLTGNYLTAHE